MGIRLLPPQLKKFGRVCPLGEAGLEGMVVGVDFMVLMHAAIARKSVANQFWVEPAVPVTAVLEYFDEYVKALRNVAKVAQIVFVLDGLCPPSKEREGARRRALREVDTAELRRLFSDGTPADLAEVERLKKKCVFPRTDVVALVMAWVLEGSHGTLLSAPFEADGQLVHEERAGRIDAIISVDSDLFVLGAKWLILDLHSSDRSWSCVVVKRESVLPRLDEVVLGPELVGVGRTLRTGYLLQEFCSFLGSDFVPQLAGWGWKTVVKYFRTQWVTLATQAERTAEILRLSQEHTFNPAMLAVGLLPGEYPALFSCSVASLSGPPVLHLDFPMRDILNYSVGAEGILPNLGLSTSAMDIETEMLHSPAPSPAHALAHARLEAMTTAQRHAHLQSLLEDASSTDVVVR
ncbi:PIN domain-like protein [Ochromonadaceae sp. CCMP2298]|nr:PIN domain-like protein [Ochromonadaceae sp. CCMP2298]